jgi:hypothetical protein
MHSGLLCTGVKRIEYRPKRDDHSTWFHMTYAKTLCRVCNRQGTDYFHGRLSRSDVDFIFGKRAFTKPTLRDNSKEVYCTWFCMDEEGGMSDWETACFETFDFNPDCDGGPLSYNMQFCPYCGRKIKENYR